ncbi:UNVERIFIED_CONTAM: hypothetical protein FKN15_046571 [Acipenser sinensis]
MTGLQKTAVVAINHELKRFAGPGPSNWISQVRRKSSLLSVLVCCITDTKSLPTITAALWNSDFSGRSFSFVTAEPQICKGLVDNWSSFSAFCTVFLPKHTQYLKCIHTYSRANGDKVLSKVLPDIGKVFKLEVVLDQYPDRLYGELVDNMEQMGDWNPNVKQVKGWLPKTIINQVLSQTQMDFAQHLRDRMETTALPC